jgi:hypothetical protein
VVYLPSYKEKRWCTQRAGKQRGREEGRASEKVESRAQGAGEQRQLGGGQGAHVVGKPVLGDADQAFAANPARMFQSIFRPYGDLRFESATTCEHRGADDRRELSGTLNTGPLRKFLRYQFDLPDTANTFISFNYDLALDRCVQQEAKERWNAQDVYGFPILHFIRPDEGKQHMGQFAGKKVGAFGVLHTTLLDPPTLECSVTILKPHGSLNFVFPFEGNYNFKDGPAIMILNDARELTYYDGFDLQYVALANTAMPEANRSLYLVPPTSAKNSGLAAITAIREKVAQALQEADEIYVIGWSMPATDEDQQEFISNAMRSRTAALQRLTVVNYKATADYFDRIATIFRESRANVVEFNKGFIPFARRALTLNLR